MDSKPVPKKNSLYWIGGQVLVMVGAVICLAVVSIFSTQQAGDLWPLPGFYFIEITVLALLTAASKLLETVAWKNTDMVLPWIATGALLPFVLLGGFTIGPFLLPAMLCFLLAGILTDLRLRQRMGTHVRLAIMAALVQGALMSIAILLN